MGPLLRLWQYGHKKQQPSYWASNRIQKRDISKIYDVFLDVIDDSDHAIDTLVGDSQQCPLACVGMLNMLSSGMDPVGGGGGPYSPKQ